MSRACAALLLLVSMLPGADHGGWDHLDGTAMAAVRWRGDAPAAADAGRQRWTRLLSEPRLRAACLEVAAAAISTNEKLSASGTLLADLGFTWDDLGCVLAGEVGAALVVVPGGRPDGRSLAEVALWMHIPEALWTRVLAAIDAQVASGTATRRDILRDGRTCHAIAATEHDMALVLSRQDDGRTWARIGSQDESVEARADRLARWISTPAGDEGIARRAMAARVLGHGRGGSLLEGTADIGGIIASVRADKPHTDAAAFATMQALCGLDALGMAAIDLHCEAGWCGWLMALNTTGPRRGLLAMLDAMPAPTQAPAWLPAEALSVTHLTVDLARVLESVRQVMSADPTLRGHLETAENAIPAFAAGLTAQQIATAIGRSWWQIDLPESVEQLAAGDDRKALVVELADPATVSRLLPLASLAGQGRGLRFVTEQGAQGLRIDADIEAMSPEIAAFISGQHLVIGIGSGVASEILAALTRGDGRWSATTHAATGLRQLPSRPLLLWAVEDSATVARMAPAQLRAALELFTVASEDDRLTQALEGLGEALPDAEALVDALAGPQTSAVWDDNGVIRLCIGEDMAIAP